MNKAHIFRLAMVACAVGLQLSCLPASATVGSTPTPAPRSTPNPIAVSIIQGQILAGLNRAFPGAANSTTDIYFSGNYAMANWISGEKGGVDVFVLSNGAWKFLFGGAGMPDESTLIAHGVPAATAADLLSQLPPL